MPLYDIARHPLEGEPDVLGAGPAHLGEDGRGDDVARLQLVGEALPGVVQQAIAPSPRADSEMRKARPGFSLHRVVG